ncbi:hypothetical protein ABEW34_19800 [Paenibacillus algorifonticola]|uniref:Uncharacterized protein n=2 Tax=unclassified Paenibacillus TaxID=185978 RepID=A0A1B2DN89_9BACL|nr:hypothetical protein [Paenibacillus sp. BIHB 4019]ANY69185.1 hypothetical protein BBD42_23890 [Paenibacillus sp. BIHB 4019]KQO00767.1 hypothetical protein ASF12_18125 [Paenibacillus sp. Leaf72]
MKSTCENFRFVEKSWPRRDLTFKFYSNGELTIIDNSSEEVISPNDLRGDSLDFYIRRRIAFIKTTLLVSQLKYA